MSVVFVQLKQNNAFASGRRLLYKCLLTFLLVKFELGASFKLKVFVRFSEGAERRMCWLNCTWILTKCRSLNIELSLLFHCNAKFFRDSWSLYWFNDNLRCISYITYRMIYFFYLFILFFTYRRYIHRLCKIFCTNTSHHVMDMITILRGIYHFDDVLMYVVPVCVCVFGMDVFLFLFIQTYI